MITKKIRSSRDDDEMLAYEMLSPPRPSIPLHFYVPALHFWDGVKPVAI